MMVRTSLITRVYRGSILVKLLVIILMRFRNKISFRFAKIPKWRRRLSIFVKNFKFPKTSENFEFCWISKICSSIVSNVKKSWILKAFCFCVIDVERVSRNIHFIKTSPSSRFNLGIWLVHWRTTNLLLSRWPLSSLYLGNVQIHIFR